MTFIISKFLPKTLKLHLFCLSQFKLKENRLLSTIFSKQYCSDRQSNVVVKPVKRNFDHFYSFFKENNEYTCTTVPIIAQLANQKFNFKHTGAMKIDVFRYPESKEEIRALSFQSIKELLTILAVEQTNHSEKLLRWLDEECSIRASQLSIDSSLYFVDAWYTIHNQNAFNKLFFKALVPFWQKRVKYMSKCNLVQVTYVFGLAKSSHKFLSDLEKKIEENVDQLSIDELAIICNSYFRAKTKINSTKILSSVCYTIVNSINTIDRFNLICFVKVLRHSQYYDIKLCDVIRNHVLENCLLFNFVECSHLLAFFSALKCYDYNVFLQLEKHGIELLLKDLSSEAPQSFNIHPSYQIRSKDIAKYLWAFSEVCHNVSSEKFFPIIVNCLHKKCQNNLKKNYRYLLDALCSLIIMNQYHLKLFQLLNFVPKDFHLLQQDKPFYQLAFLELSAQIENAYCHSVMTKEVKDLSKCFLHTVLKDINDRKGFQKILSIFKTFYSAEDIKCCYSLPHIPILNIEVKIVSLELHSAFEKQNDTVNKSQIFINENLLTLLKGEKKSAKIENMSSDNFYHTVYIEILDETVCIQGNQSPTGLMAAKIRQMQKLNHHIVPMSTSTISNLEKLPADEVKKFIFSILYDK